MQKKKLSRRHLHLFDRTGCGAKSTVLEASDDDSSTNNNDMSVVAYQDELFDQFAKAVCDAGVVARKEVWVIYILLTCIVIIDLLAVYISCITAYIYQNFF